MAKKEKEEVRQGEKPKETTVEFLASLAGVLVTGLFIITFVLQAFEIPSSSMEDTLLIGDHVFVNREQFAPATHWLGPLLPYREIRRGDIVVFLSPEERGLFVVNGVRPGRRVALRRKTDVERQAAGTAGGIGRQGAGPARSLPLRLRRHPDSKAARQHAACHAE